MQKYQADYHPHRATMSSNHTRLDRELGPNVLPKGPAFVVLMYASNMATYLKLGEWTACIA